MKCVYVHYGWLGGFIRQKMYDVWENLLVHAKKRSEIVLSSCSFHVKPIIRFIISILLLLSQE